MTYLIEHPGLKKLSNACKDAQLRLADLLLDPAAAPDSVRQHVAACDTCTAELAAFRATMNVMDAWEAPAPSPFFDTRLFARLREEQAAAPEGFIERVRSFLLFSTGRQFRPAMAGALALVLIAGGGSFVGVHGVPGRSTQSSATVNDLKILDNNAQAMQQMDQLLDDNAPDADPNPAS